MTKKRERKLTVTQQIMVCVHEKLDKYTHDLTRRQYTRQVKQYVKFCRETYNCRTFDECAAHIQDYSNYLQSKEYTASTIHTYLAAVCNVFEIELASIQKPTRHVADYIRGRNGGGIDATNDLNNPQYSYIRPILTYTSLSTMPTEKRSHSKRR